MNWTDERIQTALRSLATAIDWPRGPDLAAKVASRTTAAPTGTRRWLVLAAAGLAILLFSFTTPGQAAFAWLLRVSGIRIEMSEPSAPLRPPTTLVGGIETSFVEAEEAVGFDLRRPQALEAPDSVQLLRWGGGQQVAMIWSESKDLPEVFDTGIGLLLIQFAARVDEQLLIKEASEATQIEPVRVSGAMGYFLSGAPHTVFFENPDGLIANDEIRLTGNVLVWMSNGVTYRIESALGLEESLRIAESLD
ncbi:MAG: hypothetical protein ACRDWA_05985 [Acidimicrobiia bacterium]